MLALGKVVESGQAFLCWLLTDCDEGALLGDNSMEDLEDTSSNNLDADVSMHCTVHRALQRLCMMLLALIMLESLTAVLMRTFT